MIEMYDLPHFIFMLTSNETSVLRWDNIDDLEKIIQKLRHNFSWKDCPVKCTYLFHARVKEFLNSYIIRGNKLLEQVEHYVI